MSFEQMQDGQDNHDKLQLQIETANRNNERMKLAAELENLQSAMSTDLSALRERREARKATARERAPASDSPASSGDLPASSGVHKCSTCGETFQLVGSLRLHESRCGKVLQKTRLQPSVQASQPAPTGWGGSGEGVARTTAPIRSAPQRAAPPARESSPPKRTSFVGLSPSPTRAPQPRSVSPSRERAYNASPVSRFAASTASVEGSTPTAAPATMLVDTPMLTPTTAPATMLIDTPMGKVVVPIGTDAAGAVAALRAQQAAESPYSAASGSTFATQASPTRASPERGWGSPDRSFMTSPDRSFMTSPDRSFMTSPQSATFETPTQSVQSSPGAISSFSHAASVDSGPKLRSRSPSRKPPQHTTPAAPQPAAAAQIAVLPSPKPWPTHEQRPRPFWRGGVPVRGHPAHAQHSPLLTGGRVAQSVDTTKAWQCPLCKSSNACEVDCSVAPRDVMSFGLSNRIAQNGGPTHAEVCSAISIDQYQPYSSWRYHVRCTQCCWQEFNSGGGLASSAPTINQAR